MKDFQSSTDNRICPDFSLGGIGTGRVGFSHSGRLCGFEICNKPGVFRENALCLFAVKASRKDGSLCDVRLLQSENGQNTTLCGFDESPLEVRFPFASKKYESDSFPGKITQTVFNPFIPHNETDSGIPCAFFEFEIENTSGEPIKYSLAGVVNNFLPNPENSVGCTQSGALYISMSGEGKVSDATDGNLCFATDAKSFSYLENVNSLEDFISDFARNDSLESKTQNNGTMGAVCTYLNLEPGEKKTVRFALSWYFPRYFNFVEPCQRVSIETDDEYEYRNSWRNYYAQYFESSTECVGYCFAHWERLRADTLRFTDALYNSAIDNKILKCVSDSLEILKSTRFIRLDNGSVFALSKTDNSQNGFEGEYSFKLVNEFLLDFLYPSLSQSLLENTFRYDMTTSGKVSENIHLPTAKKTDFALDIQDEKCKIDVQSALVIRAYRAFLVNGDFEQLVENWMYIARCLDLCLEDKYVLSEDNIREYALLLVGLKAGERMARIVTDKKRELDYAQRFEEGRKELSGLKIFSGNAKILEAQLHADMLSFGDIFDSEYLLSVFSQIHEKCIVGERIEKSDAFVTSALMLRRALSDKACDIVECASGENSNAPLGFAMLYALCGFTFNMYDRTIGVKPDMAFADKTGTFKSFFSLYGCFGYVEEGIDYVEINILTGKLAVRSVMTRTRPLMVLYGGRKWKFEDTGCCAKLDCDLTLTPDKKLTVIIDVKKSN